MVSVNSFLQDNSTPPHKRPIKLLCIVVIAGLALWVGLHGAIRARELQRRMVCIDNLKRMATPAVATGKIDPRSLICPSSGSLISNYVFVPLREGVLPDNRAVIAYEPKSNHGGEGGNVVFADGHAEFVSVPAYDELVSSMADANP